MNNIKKQNYVLPNDVCTETSKRDLMLHETVCETAAIGRLRQQEEEERGEFENLDRLERPSETLGLNVKFSRRNKKRF